jgi:hypothetical protein
MCLIGLLVFVLILYLLYGEIFREWTDFTGDINNYKIKKIIYKNGEVRYIPYGKLKYKPWRWKDLNYQFHTYEEAKKECELYVKLNNYKTKFEEDLKISSTELMADNTNSENFVWKIKQEQIPELDSKISNGFDIKTLFKNMGL